MNARPLIPLSPVPAPPAPRMIAYVSAATLGELLDLSEATIRDLVKRGKLPRPCRIGGSIRWDWEAVKKTLDGGGAATAEPEDPILKATLGR